VTAKDLHATVAQVDGHATPQGSSADRGTSGFSPDERSSQESTQELPRILVVEDDYLAALEVEAGLVEAGFEVVGIAISADEAVKLARSERPVLIVMDIRLRGSRDGIDAALEIFRESGIQCIFATAHQTAQTRSRAQAAAPLGWLPKPYALDSLIALVKKALAELEK
jgi:DNA-binding NarL/FixJ family response regulator